MLRPIILITIAAAALALAGGVAYAIIPDSQGVIHACYKTENGQLRVVDGDGCTPSETPLSWNQTGPPGPPGPSHVFIAKADLPVALGTSDTSVVALSVPAGSYAISAKVVVIGVPANGSCLLTTGDLSLGTLGNGYAVLALQDAAAFTSQTVIRLACKSTVSPAFAERAVLSATQVGGVN
jgi:hypothetical protein